ncbi:hypothetical protein KI387_005075, partial [Taxus chinensis]
TVKTPILSKEVVNIPPNNVLPKYIPCDIAQILSQIKVIVPIVELIRIPKHRNRAFEYLGFKEEKTTKEKGVNNMEIPLVIVKLEIPKALEELGESSEVYLGTYVVEYQLDMDQFYTSLIFKDRLVHNCMFDLGASCNVMPLK